LIAPISSSGRAYGSTTMFDDLAVDDPIDVDTGENHVLAGGLDAEPSASMGSSGGDAPRPSQTQSELPSDAAYSQHCINTV
jgi:hypothetical protein